MAIETQPGIEGQPCDWCGKPITQLPWYSAGLQHFCCLAHAEAWQASKGFPVSGAAVKTRILGNSEECKIHLEIVSALNQQVAELERQNAARLAACEAARDLLGHGLYANAHNKWVIADEVDLRAVKKQLKAAIDLAKPPSSVAAMPGTTKGA